jgi:hypothetical protein
VVPRLKSDVPVKGIRRGGETPQTLTSLAWQNQQYRNLTNAFSVEDMQNALATQYQSDADVILDDQIKRLDDIYPAYEGETININGAEKTVYNSTGERIAKSEQALRAFYNWFGDSKVVDEQGRPLVVYHGTDADFDVFDRTKTRANMDIQGNFFSPWKIDAQGYGSNVRAFYLSIQKPASSSVGYSVLKKYQGQNNAGIKAREELEKLGYDGVNNDDEEYIAFDSNQIKSVDNRGTYSKDNDNIYYQSEESGVADRINKLFKPIWAESKKFAETLQRAIRGELRTQTMLQVASQTPEVYKRLGIEDKALNLPQNVLRKINVSKHKVPLEAIERLPELIANPLVVLDSKTESGSLVSVLDEVDENGNTVVAVIKPTDKGYNVIPSVYGKEQINNLINSSPVRYVDDIEKPTTASIDLSSLQLRGGDSARGNSTRVVKKSDIVNRDFYQNDKASPRGMYEKGKRTITLFERANRSTAVHEIMHSWSDEMNRLYEQTKSEKIKQDIAVKEAWTEQEFARKFEAVELLKNRYFIKNKYFCCNLSFL